MKHLTRASRSCNQGVGRIELPPRGGEGPAQRVDTSRILMSCHHTPSVLLLNPFEGERDMYAEYLRATGFHVRARQHAEEALRAITQCRPMRL